MKHVKSMHMTAFVCASVSPFFLQAKIEMVDSLLEIEVAYNLLQWPGRCELLSNQGRTHFASAGETCAPQTPPVVLPTST